MKEENQNGKEREMTEEQIDFRALLFKYIIHWPWFVAVSYTHLTLPTNSLV